MMMQSSSIATTRMVQNLSTGEEAEQGEREEGAMDLLGPDGTLLFAEDQFFEPSRGGTLGGLFLFFSFSLIFLIFSIFCFLIFSISLGI